jgi:hypothetical protein
LGLLVTSEGIENTLSVWLLPSGGVGGGAGAGAGGVGGVGAGTDSGLARVCILGGTGSPAPLQFKFADGAVSGCLVFIPPTTPGTPHLLLVTDAGHGAVHVVDVVGRIHAGYLAPPGSIAGPRGVAASGASPLVAVSAWKKYGSGDHVVVVYRGSGAVWEAVRVIGGGFGCPGAADGQLQSPWGMRFSADGSTICVADVGNERVSLFRVADGGLVRHIATGEDCDPVDVEEVEGGWLVACNDSRTVELVSGDIAVMDLGDGGGRSSLGIAVAALALVPGLGLVVREHREYEDGSPVQVFC